MSLRPSNLFRTLARRLHGEWFKTGGWKLCWVCVTRTPVLPCGIVIHGVLRLSPVFPANFKIALDHREHSEAQTEPVARSDGSVCRRWWTVAWVVRPTLGVASSWPQGSAHHNTTWFHVYVAVLRVIHGRCFLSASSFYFITKWDWRGFFHLPPLIKRPRLLCPSWDRAVWQAVWTDRASPRRPPAPL